MIGLNALAVAGAAAYLGACPALYFPGTQARRCAWFSAIFLMALAVPWLDRSGLGIVRIFLMSGFLFHFCAWSRAKGSFLPHGPAAALFLGGCAATRFEFICLLMPFLFLSVLGWMTKGDAVFRRGALAATLALAISLPVQVYDYANGGRLSGDDSPAKNFYTLTLPEAHWLGDAVPLSLAATKPEIFPSESDFLSRFASSSNDDGDFSVRGQESAFWKEGLRNTKAHPAKFIQNWRANFNRLVFDFPYSRMAGRPAAIGSGNRALATSSLLLLTALCVYPWVRARKTLPREVLLISTWTVAGLGLRSFMSAGSDAVLPWAPCMLLMIGLISGLVLRMRIRADIAMPATVPVSSSGSP